MILNFLNFTGIIIYTRISIRPNGSVAAYDFYVTLEAPGNSVFPCHLFCRDLLNALHFADCCGICICKFTYLHSSKQTIRCAMIIVNREIYVENMVKSSIRYTLKIMHTLAFGWPGFAVVRYLTHCRVTPWWRHQMETFSALLTLCVGSWCMTKWVDTAPRLSHKVHGRYTIL